MTISHTKGRGKKIHLLLDDEYQITTDIDFWAEHYFKDGTEITQEEWESLTDSIYFKKAVDKCYDLLSRRDHSVKELKTKLLRTVDEKNADKAIEKMLEYGYLDDEKYARNLVKYLAQSRNMSKNHIKQEMFKRGIPNEIINWVMEDYEFDNVSSVVDLIMTKYRNKLNNEDGNKKVIASLMRKGFSYSDIKNAFYRIENEEYD
ncbi:regulatory protein RecX [uncultured Eubacterium sp.]|uniref:regulatory protein RecX n=1 Tax=uncultured Eubacterium sp. TaxID=165185 RepID=UPI0015B7EEBB|nr:regulatory protein RecX [uncultured Eubacterium sp.]